MGKQNAKKSPNYMKTNKQTNNKTHRIWKPKEAKKAQQKPRKTLGDSQNWTLSMFGTLVLAAASQILFHSTLVHSERCCCFTRCWANTHRPDPGSEWVIWSGSAWNGRRMLGQRDQSPFSLEAKKWSFLYLLKALNKKKDWFSWHHFWKERLLKDCIFLQESTRNVLI